MSSKEDRTPLLSVVIPTLNRPEDLNKTLLDLGQQNFIDFEVIIIDQSDQTHTQFSDFQLDLIYHHEPIPSASRARNLGLETARGKYVLFLDDDVVIENREYLNCIVKNFENSSVSGVVGPILDAKHPVRRFHRHWFSNNMSWGWMLFPRNYFVECKVVDGGAGNLAVVRDWAIQVGGMDEQFERGAFREESDFNLRYTSTFGLYQFDPKCYILHIGRQEGGTRNWTDKVKGQNHFDGAWYFTLKHATIFNFPVFVALHKLYFFNRGHLWRNPFLMIRTIGRFMIGFFNALGKIAQGPKLIHR